MFVMDPAIFGPVNDMFLALALLLSYWLGKHPQRDKEMSLIIRFLKNLALALHNPDLHQELWPYFLAEM